MIRFRSVFVKKLFKAKPHISKKCNLFMYKIDFKNEQVENLIHFTKFEKISETRLASGRNKFNLQINASLQVTLCWIFIKIDTTSGCK